MTDTWNEDLKELLEAGPKHRVEVIAVRDAMHKLADEGRDSVVAAAMTLLTDLNENIEGIFDEAREHSSGPKDWLGHVIMELLLPDLAKIVAMCTTPKSDANELQKAVVQVTRMAPVILTVLMEGAFLYQEAHAGD